MMAAAPIASALINRTDARITLVTSAAVMAAGYLIALFMMDAPWKLLLASLFIAAGTGMAYAAMPTIIMDNVPAKESGSNIGVNSLARSIGTTVAGAVMTAILTSQIVSEYASVSVPVPSLDAFKICCLVGAGVSLLAAGLTTLVSKQKSS